MKILYRVFLGFLLVITSFLGFTFLIEDQIKLAAIFIILMFFSVLLIFEIPGKAFYKFNIRNNIHFIVVAALIFFLSLVCGYGYQSGDSRFSALADPIYMYGGRFGIMLFYIFMGLVLIRLLGQGRK